MHLWATLPYQVGHLHTTSHVLLSHDVYLAGCPTTNPHLPWLPPPPRPLPAEVGTSHAVCWRVLLTPAPTAYDLLSAAQQVLAVQQLCHAPMLSHESCS